MGIQDTNLKNSIKSKNYHPKSKPLGSSKNLILIDWYTVIMPSLLCSGWKRTSEKMSIDLFTARHKVVHNGEYPNFKGLLFEKKTNYLAQILQSLSYKVCSIVLPKFKIFGLFIPILGTSAVMDQTAYCHNVTTSETGL